MATSIMLDAEPTHSALLLRSNTWWPSFRIWHQESCPVAPSLQHNVSPSGSQIVVRHSLWQCPDYNKNFLVMVSETSFWICIFRWQSRDITVMLLMGWV